MHLCSLSKRSDQKTKMSQLLVDLWTEEKLKEGEMYWSWYAWYSIFLSPWKKHMSSCESNEQCCLCSTSPRTQRTNPPERATFFLFQISRSFTIWKWASTMVCYYLGQKKKKKKKKKRTITNQHNYCDIEESSCLIQRGTASADDLATAATSRIAAKSDCSRIQRTLCVKLSNRVEHYFAGRTTTLWKSDCRSFDIKLILISFIFTMVPFFCQR